MTMYSNATAIDVNRPREVGERGFPRDDVIEAGEHTKSDGACHQVYYVVPDIEPVPVQTGVASLNGRSGIVYDTGQYIGRVERGGHSGEWAKLAG